MEQKVKSAKFQFKNFLISKSLIEIKEGDIGKSFNLKFEPKGFINKADSSFRLQLGVVINDKEKQLNVNIVTNGYFKFDTDITAKELEAYFYTNAPAIIFPYVRAYLSTLSTLSGISPITLPTLNMQSLGKDLKNNTVEI